MQQTQNGVYGTLVLERWRPQIHRRARSWRLNGDEVEPDGVMGTCGGTGSTHGIDRFCSVTFTATLNSVSGPIIPPRAICAALLRMRSRRTRSSLPHLSTALIAALARTPAIVKNAARDGWRPCSRKYVPVAPAKIPIITYQKIGSFSRLLDRG